MRLYMHVAAAALILVSGCNAGTQADEVGAGDTNQASAADLPPSGGPPSADSDMSRNEAQTAQSGNLASASLLETSAPADGARLSASPENLVLNFREPVRLQEVTVHGSDEQTMPMMIAAADSLRSFSLPMPYLEPGSYSVQWRATDQAGSSHEGSLSFLIA